MREEVWMGPVGYTEGNFPSQESTLEPFSGLGHSLSLHHAHSLPANGFLVDQMLKTDKMGISPNRASSLPYPPYSNPTDFQNPSGSSTWNYKTQVCLSSIQIVPCCESMTVPDWAQSYSVNQNIQLSFVEAFFVQYFEYFEGFGSWF